MSLRFPTDIKASIQRLVESGHFENADAALREAVGLLAERDQRLAWLRAAITEADEQIARGEGIPYTAELLDEIDQEVEERFRRGERPSPDACA